MTGEIENEFNNALLCLQRDEIAAVHKYVAMVARESYEEGCQNAGTEHREY